MTVIVEPPAPVAEIRRDRWDRPLIAPPGGGKEVAYQRTTRFVSALSDTFALGKWQQRMVALGMGSRQDLVLAAAAADPADGKLLDGICAKAAETAGSGRAATIGSALHRLTEQIDRGEAPKSVPEEYRADLTAYQDTTEPLRPVAVEQFRVCDELRVAGTADRIVRWRDRLMVADLKTGSVEHSIGQICMQLAVYANSVPYDPATGQRRPDPEPVDLANALLIHLPAGQGRCELHWVDIRAGWEDCELAARVWACRKRKWRELTAPFTA